jgi:hypothetical protein
MESEVKPPILAVLNEGRLSGPRLSPVEIVAKMGVFDAREKAYDTAWLATGDTVIVSLWAEELHIAADGRWFCLESLNPQFRPGGKARAESQIQKATDRIALLKRMHAEGRGFRAVLQTNRMPIAELESNRAAKIATRVRDPEEWFVAAWKGEHQIAVLARGAAGWAPTDADWQAASGVLGVAGAGLGAADGVSQDELQAAALNYVTKHFRGYGYKAEKPAGDKPGYDFEISNAKGATLLRVSVKGIAPKAPKFRLTAEERACAAREPLWKLLVVSDAVSPAAQHKIYKPTEVEQAEGFEPG